MNALSSPREKSKIHRSKSHQAPAIDGHRAVRVRGKLAYPTGSSIDKTAFYLAISTYIADGKHTISLEASAPVDVDESVFTRNN